MKYWFSFLQLYFHKDMKRLWKSSKLFELPVLRSKNSSCVFAFRQALFGKHLRFQFFKHLKELLLQDPQYQYWSHLRVVQEKVFVRAVISDFLCLVKDEAKCWRFFYRSFKSFLDCAICSSVTFRWCQRSSCYQCSIQTCECFRCSHPRLWHGFFARSFSQFLPSGP